MVYLKKADGKDFSEIFNPDVKAFKGNQLVRTRNATLGYATFCFPDSQLITFEAAYQGQTLRKTVKTPAEVTLQFLPLSIVTLLDHQGQALFGQQVQAYIAESPATTKAKTQYTDFYGQAYFTTQAGRSITFNPRCPGFSGSQTITSPANVTLILPQTTTVTLKKANGSPLQTHVLAYKDNTYITNVYADSSGRATFCFESGQIISFRASFQGETLNQTVTTPVDIDLVFTHQ